MASSGRRVVFLGGVLGLAAVLLLAACGTSSATREALKTARVELGHVHPEDLGQVLGHGSFGSTGVSGGPPTAFDAVRTEIPTGSLMARIGDRMQQAGFAPFVRCRPPAACTWERRVDDTLITADALVKTAGQRWGRSRRRTARSHLALGSFKCR